MRTGQGQADRKAQEPCPDLDPGGSQAAASLNGQDRLGPKAAKTRGEVGGVAAEPRQGKKNAKQWVLGSRTRDPKIQQEARARSGSTWRGAEARARGGQGSRTVAFPAGP